MQQQGSKEQAMSEQAPIMTESKNTDVIIIGAGPVGLYAIFQCGMLGMKTVVIDALDDIGGQCTALYPEKPIYDVAGFPNIESAHLIARLEQQSAPFHPEYHLGQQVTGLEKTDTGWTITTAKGLTVSAKAIIIAAGFQMSASMRPDKPSRSNT